MSDDRTRALLDRMERAVVSMAERVRQGETPTLDEMAAAAAFSPFHFHRAYRLLTGETPGDTLRRLRAAHAVASLTKEGSVTAAAMEAGYASSQALAKALRSLGAAPASELKRDPERLDAAFAAVAATGPAPGALGLTVEAARTLPFEVIVHRHVGDPAQLNGVYGMLFEAAGGPEGVAAILGFPHADEAFEPLESQVFDAALRLTDTGEAASEDEERKSGVESGLYLAARVIGDFDGLADPIDRVVAVALVAPGVELADRPVMLHYLDDPEETPPEEQRADVYVPVTLTD